MSILIVDDDAALVDKMVAVLRTEGYPTLTAGSAGEALNLLENAASVNSEVELVLLDLFLPDLLGVEVCGRIKASPSIREIPVIMMSVPGNESFIREAFELGAADYIEKPFGNIELLTRVSLALRLKSEMDVRNRQSQQLQSLMEQLRRTNEQLLQWSLVDTLTGLHNRRFFDLFVESEFNQARRESKPIALVMIDVDFFKRYNDSLGHQQGDDCLRRLGEVFSQIVNNDFNMVARYGGEEFAVVLPETNVEKAVVIAESLRLAVAGLGLPHPRSPLGHVTISQGVASCIPDDGRQASQLIEAADQSLYQAKQRGRNQVYFAIDI